MLILFVVFCFSVVENKDAGSVAAVVNNGGRSMGFFLFFCQLSDVGRDD